MYFRNWEPCYELCLPLMIMTYLPILNFPSGHHKGTLNFFPSLESFMDRSDFEVICEVNKIL